MMTNLFSSFDPTAILNTPLNWASTSICILFTPLSFWWIPSRLNFFWHRISSMLNNELKVLLNNNNLPGMTHIFFSLFILILFNNFMGLFPYIFTSTSHLVMTFSLALTLWLSLMLYGWIKNTLHMFAHLLPQSTPLFLMSFMVLIETTSNIIRPLTLSVRLMANMMAGHLLLTLLGNLNLNASYMLLSLIIMLQILLIMLESAVAMIQAYVFTILTSLYTSETS